MKDEPSPAPKTECAETKSVTVDSAHQLGDEEVHSMINRTYDTDVDPEAPNEARAFALRLIGGGKRVLEFGCSTGRVTKALVDRGCRVTGIEIDSDAAERARAYAEEVIVLDLDHDDFETKLAGQLWETALFGDVLEHLRDPERVLRATRHLLEPRGTVIISVPNIAHADVRLALLSGSFPQMPYGLLDRTHLHFFTLKTLKQLISDAGFVATDILRVTVPICSSELQPGRENFSPAVMDAILADPEAESYQYVVRAVRDDVDGILHNLAARCEGLEAEVDKCRAELSECQASIVSHEEAILASQQRALEAEAELHAITSGRLMRYSAPFRRLHQRMRRSP
jgi:2-polyprenyl-3-methyl-5-hydroxy-6-metoxy-1,4-benzoquinol methylase